jgi:hypothetical protein
MTAASALERAHAPAPAASQLVTDSGSVSVSGSATGSAGPGSLWGHKGLAHEPPKSLILTLIVICTVGYALALCINGAAGQLLQPRFQVPPASDPIASNLGAIVRIWDPMFLISAFRCLAALVLCLVMWRMGDVPAAPVLLLDRALLVPFIIG